jgi:hypothetical protein
MAMLFDWVKCTTCGDQRQFLVSVLAANQDYCPVCKPKTSIDHAYRNAVIARKRLNTRKRNRMRLALVFYAKPGTLPARYFIQVNRRGRIEVGDVVQAVPCDPKTGHPTDPGERPCGWKCCEIRNVHGQRLHILEAW